jgi:hypothetical protein
MHLQVQLSQALRDLSFIRSLYLLLYVGEQENSCRHQPDTYGPLTLRGCHGCREQKETSTGSGMLVNILYIAWPGLVILIM